MGNVVKIEEAQAGKPQAEEEFQDPFKAANLRSRWAGKKAENPSFLVDGLVPETGATGLFAREGCSKTAMAVSLLLAVTDQENEGGTWLGAPVKKKGTVYMLTEEDEQNMMLRLSDDGVEYEDISDRFFPLCVDTPELKAKLELGEKRKRNIRSRKIFTKDGDVTAFGENVFVALEQENISLLIIDTMAAYLGVDTDKEAELTYDALKYLNAHAKQNNYATLILGHTNKAETSDDRDARKAVKGTQAILGALRVALYARFGSAEEVEMAGKKLNTKIGHEQLIVVHVMKENVKGCDKSLKFLLKQKDGSPKDVTHIVRDTPADFYAAHERLLDQLVDAIKAFAEGGNPLTVSGANNGIFAMKAELTKTWPELKRIVKSGTEKDHRKLGAKELVDHLCMEGRLTRCTNGKLDVPEGPIAREHFGVIKTDEA